MRRLDSIGQFLADLKTQRIRNDDAHIRLGMCNPVLPEVNLRSDTVKLPIGLSVEISLEVDGLLHQIVIDVIPVDLALECREQIDGIVVGFLRLVVMFDEESVLLVDLIPGTDIFVDRIHRIRAGHVRRRKHREEAGSRLTGLIGIGEVEPKAPVLALSYKTRRIVDAHAAALRLGHERLHDLHVDLPEDVESTEIAHRHAGNVLRDIQLGGNVLRQRLERLPRPHAVLPVIEERERRMGELIALVADRRIEGVVKEPVGEVDDTRIRRVLVPVVDAKPLPERRFEPVLRQLVDAVGLALGQLLQENDKHMLDLQVVAHAAGRAHQRQLDLLRRRTALQLRQQVRHVPLALLRLEERQHLLRDNAACLLRERHLAHHHRHGIRTERHPRQEQVVQPVVGYRRLCLR